uniref:Integrase catalytic domain-containing protein n=1 Tax=Tanacetum cinerariifolium TaxID=118510 RepID=A0A699GUR7_TANCI|nr:hypothetical protein [Tanacetum cinerariifolium]
MATTVVNNSLFRMFFEKQKLTGLNFMDWYRNLRIVLSVEDKLPYLEQPIPALPVLPAGQVTPSDVLAAHSAWVKASKKIDGLMLMTMNPEIQKTMEHLGAYDMLKELKMLYVQQSYIDNLECLGHAMTWNLAVSLILVSLRKEYDGFVQNYNMHSMGKTVTKFHAMLKLHEQALPQKEAAPALHAISARRGLKRSRKLKPGALSLYVGDGHSAAVEAIGEFHLCLPSGLDYALESAACILNMVPTKKVDKTPYEVWHGSIKCIFVGYPKEMMGYSFYYPPENKVFVVQNDEYFENDIINQEASRSLEDLEIIQEEDMHPSLDTSLNHEDDDQEIDEPQSDINLIRRSIRTRRPTDRLCLYVDDEEHELGDLVWELVDLSPNGKTVGHKWLFKKKTNMDGAVYTYKARLVVKGFTQTPWVDYEETFSLVADIRAIRILIAIAAFYDYEIWKMDVKIAFLKGYLNEEEVENQLKKTIKSLHSDRGCEYMSQEFLDHLKEHVIIAHRTPPYMPQHNDVSERKDRTLLDMNDEYFENDVINQEASGSLEDLEIIQEEDMHPSLDTSLNHEDDDQETDEPQSDINLIRRSIRTRRPIDRLCLYVDDEEHKLGDLGEPANYKFALLDPESDKWLNAMNIEMQSMKYKETNMDEAVYTYKAHLVIKGFTQTSWVDYEETFSLVADIRAIRILIAIAGFYDYEIWKMDVKTAFLKIYLNEETGYVFVLNGGVVEWKSTKQSIFATSSTDAEYIAAFDASKEAVWIRKFISRLGVVPTIEEPINMYYDNTVAIAIAKDHEVTKGARHFHAKVHYLRETIEIGDVRIEKVNTYDNLADPLTKALAFPKHSELTEKIGMIPASSLM